MPARRNDRTCIETAMRVLVVVDALARDGRPYSEVVAAVREHLGLSAAGSYRYVATAAAVLGLGLVPLGKTSALKVVRRAA